MAYPVLTENKLLKPVAVSMAPAEIAYDLADVFECWVDPRHWPEFCERIDFKRLRGERYREDVPYAACALKELSWDREIRKYLPKKHFSGLTNIVSLLIEQNDAEEGLLCTNGGDDVGPSNVFYICTKTGETLPMSAKWSGYDGNWDVRLFPADNPFWGKWDRACRIICPGTASL